MSKYSVVSNVIKKSNNIPIRVCSMKRSGTHILCAYIWNNFNLPNSGRVLVAGKHYFQIGENKQTLVPWAEIFGSHREYSHKKMLIPDKEIVYIIRNPLDSFKSLYKLDAYNISFDKFCSEGRIEFWNKHVMEYLKNVNTIVYYEDLITDPIKSMKILKENFHLEQKYDALIIVKDKVGWYPKFKAKEVPKITPAIRKRFQSIVSSEIGYNF